MADQLEKLQQANWNSAQSISFSLDLIPSALQLLRFLASVDRHRCLYQGPGVSRAIHRYENCWLPLLAESEGGFTPTGLPLQPPLDCAWIWHCHRLNPVVYARDCELLYGRLLGALPSVDTNEATESTQRLWEERFPQEKYCLDLTQFHYDNQWQPPPSNASRKIKYNLDDASARQRTFYYQVSQTHMKDESFLRAAEQRYKGFLHLFRMTDCKVFLVPTYDIDLMWHAHQLNPEAYTQDITHILGRVLEHDDSDSDRSSGHKLDEGFHKTRQQWQQNYGCTYERAGAMYRGEPPVPISLPPPTPPSADFMPTTEVGTPLDYTPISPRQVMQVYLTIVGARNVPTKKKGTLRVCLQMDKKCSAFNLETHSIPLLSEVVWNDNWTFQAEKSTEGLRLELLLRHSNPIREKLAGSEVLGQMHLPWQTVLSLPTLSYDGWFGLSPKSSRSSSMKHPSLFISVSLTPPQPAPQLFRTINSIPTDDMRRMDLVRFRLFSKKRGCWLTRTVLDHANAEVFIVRAWYSDGHSSNPSRSPEKERIYIHQGGWEYPDNSSNIGTAPAKIVAVAEQVLNGQETQATLSMRRCWGFFNKSTQLIVSRAMEDPLWNTRPLLELRGSLQDQISLTCGRKLDYEVKGTTEEEEGGFVTLIRYSSIDAPLGKATALFNWRTGAMEVSPEESVVLVLLLANIIAMSVFDMEGLKIKLKHGRRPPNRSVRSSDEWGSVVLVTRDTSALSKSKSMIPYYCWWDMSPITWASDFYNPGNALFGGSGCGAAGVCGAGACGGSAGGGG